MGLDLLAHWLHLVAAITWIGGSLFAAVILQPVLGKSLSPTTRMPLYHEMGVRFRRVQLASLGILVVTGLYKIWDLRGTPEIFRSAFGAILLLKLLLVLLVAILTALHSFIWGPRLTELKDQASSPEFQLLLKRLKGWGKVNLLLALAIILCAAFLHFQLTQRNTTAL